MPDVNRTINEPELKAALAEAIEGIGYTVDDLAAGLVRANVISDREAHDATRANYFPQFGMVTRAGEKECLMLLKAVGQRLETLRKDLEEEG